MIYAFYKLKKGVFCRWFLYWVEKLFDPISLQFDYYNSQENQGPSQIIMFDSYLKKKKQIDVISISSE